MKIKHIWFDFSETIASINKENHDRLRHESYANAVGKTLTTELITEYENLYEEHKHSNSSIFAALGLPAGFWSKIISTHAHYELIDNNIPEILEKISKIIPISIFSNIDLERVLPKVHINSKWFNNIISSSMVGKPKPALDGFYKMIELSDLPPEEILYIGDHVGKDVIPAKSVGIKTGIVFTEAKEADFCFSDFKDILEFVKSNAKSV